MKTTISCLILLASFAGISAQEIKPNKQNSSDSKLISTTTNTDTAAEAKNSLEKDICYSEQSKKAFYEALIRQSDLNIDLKKNNQGLVLRTTEDMIKNKKNRISYSK